MFHQACSSLVRAARPTRTAAMSSTRAFSVKLPDLPYDYSALAPIISPEIMEVCTFARARVWYISFRKFIEALHILLEKNYTVE
jgi:hypothetical protein